MYLNRMAIYIDNFAEEFPTMCKYQRMKMSHMMSDTSLEELHQFAESLGLKRSWFQRSGGAHYDVAMGKRKLALEKGAVDLPIRIGGKPNKEWTRVVSIARKLLKE